MQHTFNALGQPIGLPLPEWAPPAPPARKPMQGRYCRLEPLDPARNAEELYASTLLDPEGRNWTYLPYGPFDSFGSYRDWLVESSRSDDPLFFSVIREVDGKPVGLVAYLRIQAEIGSIEVGHLNYSEQMKRSPVATEAMFLMMQRAFQLGYRRYEWKCDALNAPSRAAAERLGFTYEGTFRKATIYKGRTRDTAWFSIIDTEWPAIARAFEHWLAPENFDAAGQQRRSLREIRENWNS